MNIWFIGPDARDYRIMYSEFDDIKKYSFLFFPSNEKTKRQCYVDIDCFIKDNNIIGKTLIIVSGRVYERFGNKLVVFLKNRIKGAVVVLYLVDVVPSYCFEIDDACFAFDKVFTYDEGDSRKYNLEFCQEPFSKYNVDDENVLFDLSYIGAAKNRTDTIISVYNSATAIGLKCMFYIFGLEEEKQINLPGIVYNRFIDFDEVIRSVKRTRIILEVLEKDMYSPTTRFAEAVLYDRILISNSPRFKNNNDYKNVIYFEDANKIDWAQILNKKVFIDDNLKQIFSIERMKNTILEGVKGI